MNAIGPEQFYETFHLARRELGKVIVGHDRAVEHLLAAVFAGGHVLLTGLPGLGRTLLVKTLAEVFGLEYRRIQFTPDLLPSDIIGTEVLEHHVATGERGFRFFKGPVFANLVLADEVNRSPTRTQAALLEVMQERQVTHGGHTFFLPRPFMLIATENSLDSEGVWRLGEAQVDRFLMSIEQVYPSESEEREIVRRTTGPHGSQVIRIATPEMVVAMQELTREVPVVPSVRDFALALVRASRPEENNPLTEQVRLGASPRAAQSMLLAAKAIALARGRKHVSRQDVIDVAHPVLVHRILLDVRTQGIGHGFNEFLSGLIERANERALPELSRWSREILKTRGER